MQSGLGNAKRSGDCGGGGDGRRERERERESERERERERKGGESRCSV